MSLVFNTLDKSMSTRSTKHLPTFYLQISTVYYKVPVCSTISIISSRRTKSTEISSIFSNSISIVLTFLNLKSDENKYKSILVQYGIWVL